MADSVKQVPPSTQHPRPPAWFRYGIVAGATLILCSCRAADPGQTRLTQSSPPAPVVAQSGAAFVQDSSLQPAGHLPAEEQATTSQVVTALYVADEDAPTTRVALTSHGVPCEGPACPTQVAGPCACGVQSCGIGPADEYLCDGGDFGLPAAVRQDWGIDGLEQEDTIAHYDTVDGRTVVAPSNRVCIYAPRFGVVRRVIDLHEYARFDSAGGINQGLSLAKVEENEEAASSLNLLEPSINRAERPPSLLGEHQKLGELAQDVEVREFDGSLAPYADLSIIRAGTVSNDEAAILENGTA